MSEVSKTADNVLEVLFFMSDGKYSTPQTVARGLGINRTVVQRLLTTLVGRGYLIRHAGQYALSRRVGRLSDAVQPRLRAVVDPTVHDLARQVGETVVFQIIDGHDSVVLAESYPTRSTSLQARHEVGSRGPAISNAGGLAILASLPGKLLKTHTYGRPELASRLETIRQSGYAITSGEMQEGVSGLAVPVPMRWDFYCSIGVLVPSPDKGRLVSYRKNLDEAAHAIGSTG